MTKIQLGDKIYISDMGVIYKVEHGGHILRGVQQLPKSPFRHCQLSKHKAFGIWAWTCMTLSKAQHKLEETRITFQTITKSHHQMCKLEMQQY